MNVSCARCGDDFPTTEPHDPPAFLFQTRGGKWVCHRCIAEVVLATPKNVEGPFITRESPGRMRSDRPCPRCGERLFVAPDETPDGPVMGPDYCSACGWFEGGESDFRLAKGER